MTTTTDEIKVGDTFYDYYADGRFLFTVKAIGEVAGRAVYLGVTDDKFYEGVETLVFADTIRRQRALGMT